MKTLLWSLLLGLLMATTASAQPGPTGGDHGWGPPGGGRGWGVHGADRGWGTPSPEDRVQLLKKALNLDDKQSAKMLEILTAADEQRTALRKKYEEQVHHDVCALKKSTTGQMKSVLTAEQSAEFDKLMQLKQLMQEQHMRHRFHRRGGDNRKAKNGEPRRAPMMNCE